jgi:hypothetical protein
MSKGKWTSETRAAYYKALIEKMIHEHEERCVFVVLHDFREAWRGCTTTEDQLALCKEWVAIYVPVSVRT